MISVISGTSREGNNSIKVARQVAGMYENLGEAVALLDLQELPEAVFKPTVYAEKPDAFKTQYVDRVMESDGLVVVVPEYNGSYPGILKHFIDLLPFPESFECRPVAFIGLAGGYYGALRAVEQLQMVFGYRNAYQFNRRVFIPNAYTAFDDDGSIKDDDLRARLELQSTKFLAFTKALGSIT